MKSRFPWNVESLNCARVFFESLRCCFQTSEPAYPPLWMWQHALDEQFAIPLAISQIICWHNPTSPNSICYRNYDSTRSIRFMHCVGVVFKDPDGVIWTMIMTLQKWFTIFDLLIQDHTTLQFNRRGRVMHHRMLASVAMVLAMGPGNPPAVRVWPARTIWFGSTTVQKPDQLLPAGPNPAPYLSTSGFRLVWVDQLGPRCSSAFGVFLFMVAFRYPTVNFKILSMVQHCHFLMYWQPFYSKQVERRSLPHPENEHQSSVNNWWTCISGNLSGAWSHITMNKWIAAFMSK